MPQYPGILLGEVCRRREVRPTFRYSQTVCSGSLCTSECSIFQVQMLLLCTKEQLFCDGISELAHSIKIQSQNHEKNPTTIPEKFWTQIGFFLEIHQNNIWTQIGFFLDFFQNNTLDFFLGFFLLIFLLLDFFIY